MCMATLVNKARLVGESCGVLMVPVCSVHVVVCLVTLVRVGECNDTARLICSCVWR